MAPESRRRSKGLRTFDPVLFSLKVRLMGIVSIYIAIPTKDSIQDHVRTVAFAAVAPLP